MRKFGLFLLISLIFFVGCSNSANNRLTQVPAIVILIEGIHEFVAQGSVFVSNSRYSPTSPIIWFNPFPSYRHLFSGLGSFREY